MDVESPDPSWHGRELGLGPGSAMLSCFCSVFARQVKSGLNNLFIFSKLREALARLYRRRILRPTTRWKALDEIYKMYILLHRPDLKISDFQENV